MYMNLLKYNPPPLSKMFISNFLGGINQSLDPMLIKPNETPYAKNCYTDNGNLETCRGTKRFVNYKFNKKIDSIIPFHKTSGFELLVSSDNKLYKMNGSIPVLISDGFTSGDFDFINYQIGLDNVIILSNGTDNMKVYDGTKIRNVLNRRPVFNDDGTIKEYIDANGISHKDESTITTYAPKCEFIELHYERIWGAGEKEYPDRINFSTAGIYGSDIDDWTSPISEGDANMHGGYEEMPTWDGGKIIGIKTIFDDLVVFKSKQMFKIFGTYPGNYQKVTLFTSEGAICDRTIVSCAKGSYFLDSSGIYNYDGVNVHVVSDKIKDIIARINKNQYSKTTAIYNDNKYYLAVPLDNSESNNAVIIYDTDRNKYDLYEGINVNDFIEYNKKILFCSDDGYIYEFNVGDKFNDRPIEMTWKSFIYGSNKNMRKIADYFYFIGSGNGKVSVKCITERKEKEKIIQLSDIEKPYRVRLNNSGRRLQLQISNVEGSYICIKQPELTFEVDED